LIQQVFTTVALRFLKNLEVVWVLTVFQCCCFSWRWERHKRGVEFCWTFQKLFWVFIKIV